MDLPALLERCWLAASAGPGGGQRQRVHAQRATPDRAAPGVATCAMGPAARRVLINAHMSGFGGEAEILCSTRALPVVTQSGLCRDRNPAVQRGPDMILVHPLCCRPGLVGLMQFH